MPEHRLQRTRNAYEEPPLPEEPPHMECKRCGIWCPPDPDTGYNADGVCGGCAAEGYYLTSTDELAHEDDDYYYDRVEDDNFGEEH